MGVGQLPEYVSMKVVLAARYVGVGMVTVMVDEIEFATNRNHTPRVVVLVAPPQPPVGLVCTAPCKLPTTVLQVSEGVPNEMAVAQVVPCEIALILESKSTTLALR